MEGKARGISSDLQSGHVVSESVRKKKTIDCIGHDIDTPAREQILIANYIKFRCPYESAKVNVSCGGRCEKGLRRCFIIT